MAVIILNEENWLLFKLIKIEMHYEPNSTGVILVNQYTLLSLSLDYHFQVYHNSQFFVF